MAEAIVATITVVQTEEGQALQLVSHILQRTANADEELPILSIRTSPGPRPGEPEEDVQPPRLFHATQDLKEARQQSQATHKQLLSPSQP
jgi:hypothetical protein